jgi:hypothetical protein
MRYQDFRIVEAPEIETSSISAGNLLGIRQEILDKIESLPSSKDSKRILQKIQDILTQNKAVDNLQGYAQRIKDIGVTDDDVAKAIDQLTRLIGAAAQITTPKDRDFFFKLWEEDRIVKVDELLKGGRVYKMSELFNFYNKSRAITYIVNALAKDAGYGLGKGEFLLAVLSRRIKKAPGKGDLLIDDLSIEVKATDGGSPRFADQEVRVGQGYEQTRDAIIKKYADAIDQIGGLKKTGLSLEKYVALGQVVDDKVGFKNDTSALLGRIFPEQDSSKIVNLIVSGNAVEARQKFGEQTYNRYMDIKDDDAVLYINLAAKDEPTYVLFKTVEDLKNMGLRFKTETIYILGMSGNRDVYPQMAVVKA